MDRALYEPGHGYYRRPDAGPRSRRRLPHRARGAPDLRRGRSAGCWSRRGTRSGGRTRSPSPSPAPAPARWPRACSAGCADLDSPLLRAIRYRPVEVEPARLAAFAARLAAAGFGDARSSTSRPRPARDGRRRRERGPRRAPGPPRRRPARRARRHRRAARRRRRGGRVRRGTRRPDDHRTSPTASRAEGVTLADGQVTEVCLALDGWLASATRHLGRGVVVLVDYADEPAALHDPVSRPTGTLRASPAHAVGGGPVPPRRAPGPDRDRRPRRGPGAAARAGLEPARRDDPGASSSRRSGRATSPTAYPPPRRRRASRTRSTCGAPSPASSTRAGWAASASSSSAAGSPPGPSWRASDGSSRRALTGAGTAVPSGPCAGTAARMARPGPAGRGSPTPSTLERGSASSTTPASRSTSRTS